MFQVRLQLLVLLVLRGPLLSRPDPTQLDNRLALNEARILRHVASRRNNLRTGQQHITE
jgi:hypothetical protein